MKYSSGYTNFLTVVLIVELFFCSEHVEVISYSCVPYIKSFTYSNLIVYIDDVFYLLCTLSRSICLL